MKIHRSIRKLNPKGLVARMTLWVAGAVIAVALIVCLRAYVVIKDYYRETLLTNMDVVMSSTENSINQRLKRVEYAVNTAASVIGNQLNNPSKVDTLLQKAMNGIDCVDNVFYYSINGSGEPFIRAINRENSSFTFKTFRSKEFDVNAPNITIPYRHGKNLWDANYDTPTIIGKQTLMCYSTPLRNADGKIYGVLGARINSFYMTDIVVKNKSDENLDVVIIDDEGRYIVAPKEEDLKRDLNDFYVDRHELNEIGCKMVCMYPRSIVEDEVNGDMLSFSISMAILIVTMVIAIILTVKFIGRPYARDHAKTLAQQAAMQREMDFAANTQRRLVPHVFPPFPERKEIDIHACLHPAMDVGGDLFDYFIDGDNLFFCIGDVSGKGLQASLFMSAVHYLFRNTASKSKDIATALASINTSLSVDNESCTFVTFILGKLDLTNGMLSYCNAGHNAPILISNAGNASFLSLGDNLPIGVMDDLEFDINTLQLENGDSLLLYTDGITESMNPQREQFGDEATLACATECYDKSSKEIIEHLLERVNTHAAGATQSDDITMLCLRRTPSHG